MAFNSNTTGGEWALMAGSTDGYLSLALKTWRGGQVVNSRKAIIGRAQKPEKTQKLKPECLRIEGSSVGLRQGGQ